MMKKYYENGISSFEMHEILEVLLFSVFTRCNTNEISHRLLNEFKTIKGVLNATVSELASIKGIGENAALHIHFFGDFFSYLIQEPMERVVLDKNDRVFEYCKDLMDISLREFFMILFLDRRNTLVSKYFANGHFNFVTPDKKGITFKAVADGSVSAVAVHNHLGNSEGASSADITSTSRLRAFLHALDVELNDHLVLCNGKYVSMRDDDRSHKIWK